MSDPHPLWEQQTLTEMRELIAAGPMEVRLARPALLVLLDMALEREAAFAAGVAEERAREHVCQHGTTCTEMTLGPFRTTPPTPNP